MDLSWSGASSPNIDIYRNGVVVATTGNDGFYTDSPGGRGHATYTYQGVRSRHSDLFQSSDSDILTLG